VLPCLLFLSSRVLNVLLQKKYTATASISSAVLFVGFRNHFSVNIYFVIPAILLAKLYSITIVATFNNRTHSVGARNAPSDSPTEITTCEISSPIRNKFSRLDSSPSGQMKIGRSVVQQVWTDDVPMCDIEVSNAIYLCLRHTANPSPQCADRQGIEIIERP
jgi:hypothetical protein